MVTGDPANRAADRRVADLMGFFHYEFRDTKGQLRQSYSPTRNWSQARAFIDFLRERGLDCELRDSPRETVLNALAEVDRRAAEQRPG